VIPIGHRGTIRVALAHDGRGTGTLPAGLPSADEVASGWTKQTQAGVRLDLPPGSPTVALATLRSQLLLDGVDPSADEVEMLVGLGELVRLGEAAGPGAEAVVAAAERLVRAERRSRSLPWTVDAALASAAEVLGAAGWSTAGVDLAKARRRLVAPGPTPVEPPGGLLGVAWAQRRLVVQRPDAVDLFPAPYPAGWLGQPAEAHGVPIGCGHLGVALRWHGARPAVLWGADEPVRLTCSGLDPSWAATAAQGEVLLSAPRPAQG
jgi:hypothetical protein